MLHKLGGLGCAAHRGRALGARRTLPRLLAGWLVALSLAAMVAGCGDDEPASVPESVAEASNRVEATSLLGDALRRPRLDDDFLHEQAALLADARAQRDARPDDVEAWVWVGRRQAYLGRYREAIATYTHALDRFGPEPQVLRHRGHRYLTVRRFAVAIDDFERAAELIEGRDDEVEADGLPNALDQPTSTLGTNIYYHLGLGHYLRRDFEAAIKAYERCLELSRNDDMGVATLYWLYLAERRLGNEASARARLDSIDATTEVIENHAYLDLLRVFRGERDADEILAAAREAGPAALATTGYGIAAWRQLGGDSAQAVKLWRDIVEAGAWASFGSIAAEAEVADLTRSDLTRSDFASSDSSSDRLHSEDK